ncbi:MAG: 16S rRNA (uracil(1498)-N(3))-methyltransferase [Parvularculaceae bacterium]|nr:16S rRNA (uracil(1498)-N(3))-methyltransferase [Parvularculaceae bacterium]
MIPRLHHEGPLEAGASIALSGDEAHYLRAVLRREVGAELRLFNARDGEFGARLAEISKRGAVVAIEARRRAPKDEPDVELWFAPVKRAAVELIVQKGTELGARAFIPVLTDRTNADRLRIDRLKAIAKEAAEQCDRLSVPRIGDPRRIADALLHFDKSRTLIFCDEAGDDPSKEWGGADGRAAPMTDAMREAKRGPAAILVGPEGGFTPAERSWLRALPYVIPVTLGPRILRADTAAIVSLTLWQAAHGDLAQR